MMMLMFTMMMTRCAVESSSKSRVTTHESQLTTSHETSSSHTTATSGVYAPLHLVLQSSLEGTVSKSLAGVWTTPRTCVTGSRPTAGQLLGEWTAFFTFYVAVIRVALKEIPYGPYPNSFFKKSTSLLRPIINYTLNFPVPMPP